MSAYSIDAAFFYSEKEAAILKKIARNLTFVNGKRYTSAVSYDDECLSIYKEWHPDGFIIAVGNSKTCKKTEIPNPDFDQEAYDKYYKKFS